jgi:hydrogenase nickel incorporation protein HypA/HybF
MHEYSIASSLLRLAEEHAEKHGASRITSLEIRVGEFAGVEIELLETAWSLVRERSLCDGVALSIETVEAQWACSRCDHAVARGGLLSCPDCGSTARLSTGDELVLDRIAMEVT